MKYSTATRQIAVVAVIAANTARANSFGNYFSTGAVSSNNFIVEATTTLVLLSVPNPVKNILSLWPGMGMSNGDLVQALAISYPGDNNGANCNVVGSNWCIVASSLLQDSNTGQTEAQDAFTARPGDSIKMTYIYNTSTTAYDQQVYLNNVLRSTLSTSAGSKALGWGTAEECQPGTPCGVVPKHEWIDTSIKLNKADTGYGATAALNGVTGSISTSDGGVTWRISTITVDEFDFTTGA